MTSDISRANSKRADRIRPGLIDGPAAQEAITVKRHDLDASTPRLQTQGTRIILEQRVTQPKCDSTGQGPCEALTGT